jgi:hypothetical protein
MSNILTLITYLILTIVNGWIQRTDSQRELAMEKVLVILWIKIIVLDKLNLLRSNFRNFIIVIFITLKHHLVNIKY